jgi:hypothetical protein
MKVSKLSPFIVIPSPEGMKEKKPSSRKVSASNTSAALLDEDPLDEDKKNKVIAIGKHAQSKKKKSQNNSTSRGKAIASYNKMLIADTEALLKDNFKKKI